MAEQIEILILSVLKTKNKKCCLDYAIVDLKESENRKGYNIMRSWFDTDDIYKKIKVDDIGQVMVADVTFDILSNNQVVMRVIDVHN